MEFDGCFMGPTGYMIHYKADEAGGFTFYSEELGQVVWQSSINSAYDVLACIAKECELQRAKRHANFLRTRCKPVSP